jgi:hypothetical protein
MIWLIPVLWIANNVRLIHKDRVHVAKPGMDMSKAGDAYQYSVRNLLTKSIQGKLSLGG